MKKEKKVCTNGEPTSLINDEAHVYKGGSWKDRAYWLVPELEDILMLSESTDDIGLLCNAQSWNADSRAVIDLKSLKTPNQIGSGFFIFHHADLRAISTLLSVHRNLY